MSNRADACILVIFGASGDLTRRKLLPAIYNLAEAGLLPERFAIVGVARPRVDGGRLPRGRCASASPTRKANRSSRRNGRASRNGSTTSRASFMTTSLYRSLGAPR